MNRRTGRTMPLGASQYDRNDDTVRYSDLIRPQRVREVEWTVFQDAEQTENRQRRIPRDSLVRQRPVTWTVVEDKDDSNKENIGYVVRRPRRTNNSEGPATLSANAQDHQPETTPTPTPKNKGKRKINTATVTPKKVKASKKQKKPTVEVRVEPPSVQSQQQQRERRPLEDITHLFVDPTAHYFQPWRRASSMAMRASSMRML